jgi:hypothetical protein
VINSEDFWLDCWILGAYKIAPYYLCPSQLLALVLTVAAMKALKESLKIPARMGWNGDPCAPRAWDAWEGVTCHRGDKGLVITQL